MEKLPEPIWKAYFGIGGNKFVLAPSESELIVKAKEFGLSNKATLGRIGLCGNAHIYDILQGKVTPGKKTKFVDMFGYFPPHNWNEVKEKGFQHPMFLPQHGCFGYINGNLILGNRHHQEVMFRLINDKGWTWEQLVEAEQVWGWYHVSVDLGSINFSSDAGTMTGKKVKKACMDQFGAWFGKPFKEGNGYGGKSKKTYGGDFEYKYGTPGNWNGYKADYDNTIITPLPDPPEVN